jgi:tetratricopeptide (TPR) repeat protein
MRNGNKRCWRRFLPFLLAVAAVAAGCQRKAQETLKSTHQPGQTQLAQPQDARVALDQGYVALEQKQFDEAIARADQVLASVNHGEGSAEALYLKGRSLEGKNAAGVTEADARANLQQAREAYVAALQRNPREPLKSYVHTGLGNVAYFQDDYPAAVAQLNAAYQNLQSPETKAWVLYRIGLSQQRQGQFEQADQTFARVAEAHAGTEPARRAAQHQGVRAYAVQLATFASAQTAQSAAAELKKQGMPARVESGPEGRAFLRVGPIASYQQAQYYKNRFAQKYPDALIIP